MAEVEKLRMDTLRALSFRLKQTISSVECVQLQSNDPFDLCQTVKIRRKMLADGGNLEWS